VLLWRLVIEAMSIAASGKTGLRWINCGLMQRTYLGPTGATGRIGFREGGYGEVIGIS
jgi:hypothetical protein